MKNQYNRTVTACFVGYIVQAIVNNFAPLLFLTFQRTYGIPLSKITLLVTLNFGVQLLVDLLSVTFVLMGLMSLASGLILDTVVKGTRKQYELQVIEAYRACELTDSLG